MGFWSELFDRFEDFQEGKLVGPIAVLFTIIGVMTGLFFATFVDQNIQLATKGIIQLVIMMVGIVGSFAFAKMEYDSLEKGLAGNLGWGVLGTGGLILIQLIYFNIISTVYGVPMSVLLTVPAISVSVSGIGGILSLLWTEFTARLSYVFAPVAALFGLHLTVPLAVTISPNSNVVALFYSTSGVAETWMFQGFIYGWLFSWTENFWASALITNVLFAFEHSAVEQADIFTIAVVFLGGMGLCALYEYTNSILTPMVAHVLLNVVASSLSTVYVQGSVLVWGTFTIATFGIMAYKGAFSQGRMKIPIAVPLRNLINSVR